MSIRVTRLVNKAYHAMEKGKYSVAVKYLEKASQIAPKDSEVFAYLGEAYILNEQYDKAEESFAQRDQILLEADPLTAYIKGYRARIQWEKQGESSEQMEATLKESSQQTQGPELLYSLALLYMEKKQFLQAYQTLQKIESQDPAFYYRKIQALLSKIPPAASGHQNEASEVSEVANELSNQ